MKAMLVFLACSRLMSEVFPAGSEPEVSHKMEATQRFLEAKQRYQAEAALPEDWAQATALAFEMLMQDDCSEEAKPEWWNDEGLKALSARVLKAAPNGAAANAMRATVLSGRCGASEVGLRSAAELWEAAAHYERAAAMETPGAFRAAFADLADWCRSKACRGRVRAEATLKW